MPSPQASELGTRYTITLLRTQRGGFAFMGVKKQAPPSEILDGQLQEGVNCRLVGGRIDCRGGQSKMSNTTVSGTPIGIFDDWQGSL